MRRQWLLLIGLALALGLIYVACARRRRCGAQPGGPYDPPGVQAQAPTSQPAAMVQAPVSQPAAGTATTRRGGRGRRPATEAAQEASATQPAEAAATGPEVTILLEDFAFPAWGVRWTTLEFSKYVPPQMQTGPETPEGMTSASVGLPPGGRIVLTTQQETKDWDGSRGKFPWPIPGVPRACTFELRPTARAPSRWHSSCAGATVRRPARTP